MGGNSNGYSNVAIGNNTLRVNGSGDENVAVGTNALFNNVGSGGTAIGYNAMFNFRLNNYSKSHNTAVGYEALYSNTSGISGCAFGHRALYANTTGIANSAFGSTALANNTSGLANTAIGTEQAGSFGGVLNANTTGSYNTGLGVAALVSNTTGPYNTAVGYQAGYSNTTGNSNTFIGQFAGYSATTGSGNCFISGGGGAGYLMTTGSKNVIIGGYQGNNGGVDIRTSDNNIVLSDGDGNPRVWMDSTRMYISSRGTAGTAFGICNLSGLTMTTGTTVNLPFGTAGAMMIQFYDQGSGDGGMYFATYTGTTILVASRGNMGATAGASNFNCYKTAGSHTVTVQNNAGITRTLNISVYAGAL
jgi:hypothetical protein